MRYMIMSLRRGLSKLGCLIDASHQLSRRRLSLLSASRHILIVVLSAVLWWCPLTAKANSLPVVRIAILYDGPHSDFGVGEIFRKQLIQKEILSLTKGEFDVQFPASVQFHGGWSLKKIRKALDALLEDPSVDMILTLGLLSSNEAVKRSTFSKPVMAPFIIDPNLQNLSLKKRRGQVPNFSYLVLSESFERNLQAFKEIVPVKNLVLLQDAAILKAVPNIQKTIDQIAENNHVVIHPVSVTNSVDTIWSQLPPNTQGVYVAPLFRLPIPEFDRLVQGLIDRKLPSFSMLGLEEVERGIMAGLSSKLNHIGFSRRVALRVHRMLLGESKREIPLTVNHGEQLTINMATARAINVWPSFRVLTEAELLHEEPKNIGRQLSLYAVVREAAQVNLDLAAADRAVAAGIGAVQNARSSLLPQINIGSSGNLIDSDRAEGGFGNTPEKSMFATGSFEQLLYSDKAWTNYTVEQRRQEGRQAGRRQIELDVIQAAALGYLNVLKTKTIERIVKENLRLTRSNLELARVREQVGVAARDEVFRWESEIARGRIDVLNARAQRQQAAIGLNRILYHPLEEPFTTAEAGLQDPFLFHNIERLFAFIDNPKNFQIFRDFQVREGFRLAPELKNLQARIAAQQRLLVNAERQFWVPDLVLKSDVSQRIAQGGDGQQSS
ncbi:MAG: ABC transporter substrate binding protein, partial [Nitrospirales bacterium]